jgi:hypothetical protein
MDQAMMAHAPVVVIYPFGQLPTGPAVRAAWDPKRPTGPEAKGVRFAEQVLPNGHGWRCEGFVPWDALLAEGVHVPEQLKLNIGVWDNDGDLFTELHSWAPTADVGLWGDMDLQPAAGAAPAH